MTNSKSNWVSFLVPRADIPPQFQRTFEEKPFDTCSLCGHSLFDPDKAYAISKIFMAKKLCHEIVFCRDCLDQMSQYYSQKSIQTVRQVFSKIDKGKRWMIGDNPKLDRVKLLTGDCILCAKPKRDISDYIEAAVCLENKILFTLRPWMICMDCQQTLFNSLSDETKEQFRRIDEKYFGFPPDGSNAIDIEQLLRISI